MDWWNEMMTSDYVMFDDEWDKMCKRVWNMGLKREVKGFEKYLKWNKVYNEKKGAETF